MMTDLEDRLRHDLQQLAERAQPGSIRPLRVPLARGRSRAARWLAPVAAMAAVIAVVAGVSLASQSVARQPAFVAASGRMPPHYVTAFQSYGRKGKIVTTAQVRDSITGALLTTVHVPTLLSADGSSQSPSISAAADDRTFVITQLGQVDVPPAVKGGGHSAAHGPAEVKNIARFLLLRVAADGRSARLRRLPVRLPGSLQLTDAALSPDGTRLAMDVQSCHGDGCQLTGIRVVTLATGAARTWTTRANGAPFAVSWAGNEQVVFLWEGGRSSSPAQRQGYRLLNVTGAGGNLLAARPAGSRLLAALLAARVIAVTGYIPAALVTPDGTAVITSAVQNIPDGHGRDTVVASVFELSASTGRLLYVLRTVTEHDVVPGNNGTGQLDQECNVLSLGPAGVHALVDCFGFGRLDGSTFTPLPGSPSAARSGISGQDASAW